MTTVRNLGVQLDSELNFDDQARCCVKACYYHLRRILQIRRHVDNDCYAVSYKPSSHHAWTTVMACTPCAMRMFFKDYNAYKTAARATFSTLNHDHRHYLYFTSYTLAPVESRICKLCSLMYPVGFNIAPSYLPKLCVPCSDTHL